MLLTCLTNNPLDGTDRAEIVVKNNRGLTQEITVPAGVAYAAVEGQPEPVRQLVRTLARGADVVLLPPGGTMTVGFAEPTADRTVELTPRPSALALAGDAVFQLADLAKELGPQGRVASLAAVAKCFGVDGQMLAGVIPTGLDAVTTLLKAVLACLVDGISDPGKAVGLALDILSLTSGLTRDVLISDKAWAPKVDALTGKLSFLAKIAKVADLARLAGLIWEEVGEQVGRAFSGPDPTAVHLSLHAPALARYVGTWHAYGANLTVNSDATGTFWSNYGPCLPVDSDSTQMCAENWTFTITARNVSITGTVTRVWISTWDGQQPPAGFQQRGTAAKVGDTLRFSIPDRPDIIRMTTGSLTAEFCRTGTTAYDTGRCGG